MKLSPKALGLSFGILWGVVVFAMTLLSVYTGYLSHIAELIVGVYPYYSVTVTGSVAGLVWGFIDGLVAGVIFGWIYNLFAPSALEKI
jgi:hypothetical protein